MNTKKRLRRHHRLTPEEDRAAQLREGSEKWLPVVGYEGLYEVSNWGRVRSLNRITHYVDGRVRTFFGCVMVANWHNKIQVYQVGLTKDRVRRGHIVHRLVMLAFKPNVNSSSLEVNHLDHNRGNNYLYNLEWVTSVENKRYASAANMMPHGEYNSQAKLTDIEVEDIRRRVAAGETQTQVANEYGVSQGHVSSIVAYRNRKKKSH